MPGRTIAIGDIHGCSKALESLIALIGPRPDDTIVTLGDYVNRGPDSRGVLDQLLNLRRRCRLVPILGNHDQLLLDARSGKHPISWLIEIGGGHTLNSYRAGRDPSLIPDEHYDFLESCVDYYENETHIFVHGNYYPDLPMDRQHVGILRWESLRAMTPGPHASGKVVIVGHTSQKGGDVLDLGYLVCIDTFCHGGGWLTAYEPATRQIRQVDRRGTPRTRVF